MSHILSKAVTAVPSLDKYADSLRARLDVLKEMAEYAENVQPISSADHALGSDWREALSMVTVHGEGVYSFPYLSPEFCRDLMLELDCMDYAVNEDEPEEAQIPELVFAHYCPVLHECLRALWYDAGTTLAKVLFGQDPQVLRVIQAAKYTTENTPRGHWHADNDSDVTMVVALTNDHLGGGTVVHRGPLSPCITVPQLPVGHAMFFNGKAMRHYGLPVTSGERNLLVHWSEVK
ncbi:hypothetical protein [Pseudomonas asplenii]|uniref:hypothetical protein n=1 Tax=Pseudomonas asplenii TaxID=53407 RepID=UPI0006CDCCD0|nr:hypothetical protein [Pseudomonas fuscovaginae]KPA96926.1 hypothetical protein PF70_03082 [Pseudomonas fuscovaginae]